VEEEGGEGGRGGEGGEGGGEDGIPDLRHLSVVEDPMQGTTTVYTEGLVA